MKWNYEVGFSCNFCASQIRIPASVCGSSALMIVEQFFFPSPDSVAVSDEAFGHEDVDNQCRTDSLAVPTVFLDGNKGHHPHISV